MRTGTPFLFLFRLGVICLCFGLRTGQAQEPAVGVGDGIVVKSDAPLMSGSKKLATVPAATKLTVTAVRKQWLGVRYSVQGQELVGWIQSAQVKLGAPIDEPLGIVRKDASHFTVSPDGFALIGPGTTVMMGGPGVRLPSQPQPIQTWRLELAEESGPTPKASRLALRLILPLEDIATNARLIAQFLSESRFEVILPDGSKQSLVADVDVQQINPDVLFIGDRLEAEKANVKNAQPYTLFAMLPAQLFHLSRGKHTFRWVHENKAEELPVEVR